MIFCGWRWSLAFLLSTFIIALGAVAAETTAPAVLIVTSQEGGAYDELIDAVSEGVRVEFSDASVSVLHWRHCTPAHTSASHIVVTVGSRAASEVAAHSVDTPILHTLLPRATFTRLYGERAPPGDVQRSAVFLDQPVSRQIALLTEALPEWPRVALIAGPQTLALADELAAAANAAGLDVQTTQALSDRALYSALQDALAQPAVLIALPDSEIFNSHTIRNILLTSYRQRSPLIGFSPAYVRAGALLAIYSTPQQIAAQATTAVVNFLHGAQLPPPRYTRDFEVGINATVARSLGIRLAPAEDIADRIKQREARHD